MLGLGWYMMSIEDSPGSDWYFNLHKSIGFVVLVLVFVRSAWRLSHPPHPLPATIAQWQIRASTMSHWALYVLMLALPLLGAIGALFSKHALIFFGMAEVRLVTPNHAISVWFFFMHSFAAWLLVMMVSLHVLAALKHLFLDKDGVFQRMWF